MSMTAPWARYWAVDVHVHTPGSADADEADFGEPSEIVQAAIRAGLDCIAITDHNRADWCDRMALAAVESGLVVLPGVELSTKDGHLLGIWEEGTPGSVVEDVLIELGIKRSELGRMDVVAARGMAECAETIVEAGGIAIAAHIDKERGILRQPVQTHVNKLLAHRALSALEYVHADTVTTVRDKLRPAEPPAMVQGSDCWNASLSRHSLSGIGLRRTWIKAGRPDLVGLRHALDDPKLRVRLTDPSDHQPHPTISRVALSSGFLGGVSLELSPDLNCLLGGTGSGKSLLLEAIRFALNQQVDGSAFEKVRDEVDRRLRFALDEGTVVTLEFVTSDGQYRFRRTWGSAASASTCSQWTGAEWVDVDRDPAIDFAIAAFSQGEILEYARQPVGRVGLIDAHLDLSEVEREIGEAQAAIATNSDRLLRARTEVVALTEEAAKAPELGDQVRKLADIFETDEVKQQGYWTKEQAALDAVRDGLAQMTLPTVVVPSDVKVTLSPDHDAIFEEVNQALAGLREQAAAALELLEDGFAKAKRSVAEPRARWQSEFTEFKVRFDEELEASGSTSLSALRAQLETLQTRFNAANTAAEKLQAEAQPELDASVAERESLLAQLRTARDRRRAMRRERVKGLNRKTANLVKLDIPSNGDTSDFRKALDTLKVGSRVREEVLDRIATRVSPFRLVRALWHGDVNSLVDSELGISAADVGKMLANIDDRGLWRALLDAQTIDIADILDVKFRKPEDGSLASIEELSHGQKCTAILVILLADGDSPVLVDQPEDALHAPWIEEYLVDRLRDFRGSRQYIFATRSPGLVVSADAEQVITMRATAGHGECEASGSLERHNLNMLALHHLEGGRTPFERRARKLHASLAKSD